MSNFGHIKAIYLTPIGRAIKSIEYEKKAEQRRLERNFRERKRREKLLLNKNK